MADTTPLRILIADDQQDIIDALRLLLSDEGYDVVPARSPAEALERLEAADFDLAILDLNYTRDTTSGQEGFDLIERIRALDPTLPVLVMTAWSSVAGAVEAMRRGARDYIEKPWDDDRLLAAVRTQTELRRAVRRSQRLQEANQRLQRGATPPFVGSAPAIVEIRQTIERVAPSDASVLITGEHGTGKEVVAAWLHAYSDRRGKALVTMNAGGLAEGIAESELFGHVKGAFTDARVDRIGCFEMADEGTLFLDEIANMPMRLQAKLLRVLQTGEMARVGSSRLRYVNVRVLSATNADLQAEIAASRFREDLLYRLNTVVIHLPPLRDRRGDIESLARHFLAIYAARYRKPIAAFDRDAIAAMQAHVWPGNVRELAHSVERAVLMAEPSAPAISLRHVNLRQRSPGESSSAEDLSLEEAERVFIEKVLSKHQGDVRLAAEQLGMSRSALYRRLQQYGVRD
ncbi:MAG TPA: sigma-54 dependent transcriptional regulator [Vicinamibacterales bacterium]|jgi:DNA-binding NtrC family response regulator|nr:sigma-54 dependent transcriptional regulator [Vicinamibacterales bacterium]